MKKRNRIKQQKYDENGNRIWCRAKKFNRHHIVNKCRGGINSTSNLLIMDIERHNAWHFLFQNLSFEEVIELLTRTLKQKGVEQCQT